MNKTENKSGPLSEVLRIGERNGCGRPSGMRAPEVRQFITRSILEEKLNAGQIVGQLRERFKVEVVPESLAYWLRKWKLRRPKRLGRPERIRCPGLTRNVLERVDRELSQVSNELKAHEEWFPEDKSRARQLELQRDQLLAVFKNGEGNYTQAAIAEELDRREATINYWLNRFWRDGGNEAALEKLLAMHE